MAKHPEDQGESKPTLVFSTMRGIPGRKSGNVDVSRTLGKWLCVDQDVIHAQKTSPGTSR
jgi:hypothetical protein